MFAPFQLTCRRADNGEAVWKSPDLPDYAPYDLVGLPILADGKLFHAAKTPANPQQQRQGLPQQFVVAIQPHDGKIALEDRDRDVSPRCSSTFTITTVAIHRPSRGSCSAPARSISTRMSASWRGSIPIPAFSIGDIGYKTDPVRSGYFFWYYQPAEHDRSPEPTADPRARQFLVKGAQSERLISSILTG